MNFLTKMFLSFFLLSIKIFSQQLSFPEAEGYGKFVSGGRGGKIIEVINLNDQGPGSLRSALNYSGPRIIIFKTSGTISLNSELLITNGDLTIAGQTAPGEGICIKNYQTTINAENVIIRFIRFRLGDEKKQEADALSVMNSKNIIVDHCSFSWGIDEVFSFYDNENSTVQWCIISEALNDSYHQKGEHGYGGIWGGKNISFHHNLFAHNSSRNPRFNGARTNTLPGEEHADFYNNVIYNWGINSSYGGENGNYNIIANYYKSGPGAKKNTKNRIVEPWGTGNWFVAENFVEGSPDISEDNWNGGVQGDYTDCKDIKSNIPLCNETINYQEADKAFTDVLKFTGAIYPERDEIDVRIINEVQNNSVYSGNGIINSQTEVGGWPELISYESPADSDHDGMPDEWELKMNLNPNDPEDRNNFGSTGYTFLEEYLNELGEFPLPVYTKTLKGKNQN
jgi:pectate lyase